MSSIGNPPSLVMVRQPCFSHREGGGEAKEGCEERQVERQQQVFVVD